MGGGSNVNDGGPNVATVGKEQESSDITKTVRRLADVLEDRQELRKKMTERDQGKASDEFWIQSTECDKELPAKEEFHGLGRDELPVGRAGGTDVGSFENPEE